MPVEHLTNEVAVSETARPVWRSMRRGMMGRCPSCGSGKLFDRAFTVKSSCDVCNEELYHHRADDLPAYLNIFIIGHVVVALTMILMEMEILGVLTLTVLACVAAIALAALLMRPLKGMVVGAQWAMRMHGFGGDES